MKKSYLSVPSYFTNQDAFNSKDCNSDTSSLVTDRVLWWNRYFLFLSPKQKEKTSRKALLLRSRTRGIKLLGTIILVSLITYYYFISTTVQTDQSVLSKIDIYDLFKSIPSTDHLKKHVKHYASHVHIAGSKQDHKLAVWTRNQWIEYGITDAKIETFYPVLNYPSSRRLAIIQGPPHLLYEATLEEQKKDHVPTFHAYSGNGNVTGPVVYVNYGRISDFQSLQVRGVLFKGTIALIRNGMISKGMKVKMAEKFGCIGALLYTDPDDHGSLFLDQDDTWVSPTFVERGSVQYVSYGAGDPFTPGYASTHANTTREHHSPAMPRIPSLPISGRDALPLLKATEGYGVPSDLTWSGGLCNVSYYSGPSEALVHLVNMNDYRTKPIWNVIGTIKGSEEPHRSIIIGNHRDAWGYGAVDPSSGSAVLMEVARTLGVMIANGWRPKRTIVLASWDAEEYGAVGSTEWVEKHAHKLQHEAIAYLNVDYAVSGKHFSAQASPLLNRLLYEITEETIDPETSRTVLARWKFERGIEEESIFENVVVPLSDPLDVESDHVGFFHHLGIASLSMGFRGSFGVHHSMYDTIDWIEEFGDPTYEYHRALSQIWGLLVMRLSSDTILPMYPLDYVPEITRYMHEISSKQGCASFPFITSNLESLERTALEFEKKMTCEPKIKHKKHKEHHKKYMKYAKKINDRIARFEQALVDKEGAVVERPWFRHMVYGPDAYSGKTKYFPSLSEAFESQDPVFLQWTERRIAHILNQAENTLQFEDFKSDDVC